ncbi:MAG: hypothetical protein ACT4P3_08410, partial [Betaproteobacteria bacterium]
MNHLGPVVELLARSFAPAPRPKPRRWMKMHSAYNAVKSALALIGLAALGLLYRPAAAREAVLSWLGEAPAVQAATTVAAGPIAPSPAPAFDDEQRRVTEYIARRYRVSQVAVSGFVDTA